MAETSDSLTLDASIPTASLESILRTEELHRRPSRPPDYERENRALVKLVNALADSPSAIFQTLAETIQKITQCDSAGLSLLTRDGKTPHVEGKRFYWPAITGMWNPHVGGGTPRNFGPCGDVLGADAMSAIDGRPKDLVITTDRDEGDRVRLRVKDAGVGFEPQTADRIFEGFYTTKSDGMRIGLSVSKSIIESHDGRIWGANNDGHGSTFSFSIPCRRGTGGRAMRLPRRQPGEVQRDFGGERRPRRAQRP